MTLRDVVKFFKLCVQFEQVDPYSKDPKRRLLFEQLEQLMQAQEESIATIRTSEQEVCPYNNYTVERPIKDTPYYSHN